MQVLNEAYSVLGNPAKRARYDFLRKYYEQTFSSPKKAGTSSPAISFPQISPPQIPSIQKSFRESFITIALFFGQILYKFIYGLMIVGLTFIISIIPAIVYFFVLGYFFAWIGPYISLSSDNALVAILASTTFLTIVTFSIIVDNSFLYRFYSKERR